MTMIGVLGGMGPLATVDFMGRVVRLTQGARDQDHLPMMVANLPHTPDRSSAILGDGLDPLPALYAGVDLLNRSGVGLLVVPCNSAHHWYEQMRRRSAAPMLHIGEVCADAVPQGSGKVAVLATRGTLVSGFYQASLRERGIDFLVPDALEQARISACIAQVKAGDLAAAARLLEQALRRLEAGGATAAVMGCTEIPLAAGAIPQAPMPLIDSTQELAAATVRYALMRGWNVSA
ncbi:Aspartate racemase [Achromobacter anxifer]|uniref:aspartate/glutamate racemase family protein n=1 Tax=Achromobacter anxifer TaxID=1287737 RepID=UPI00155C1A67|nr:amino acid racemase [Achromobacter anxifer]CAB5511574.1 Aspartate racemase [Achromobacter anxifer]